MSTTVFKSQRYAKDEISIHRMVTPEKRNEIISNINNGKFIEYNKHTSYWWKNKHHPEQPIPTNLYLLGDGTLCELFERYNMKYDPISKTDFYDYVRELVKQEIIMR
jgi:hypothetical protein